MSSSDAVLTQSLRSQVDMRAKIWICPFCLQRNGLPAQYRDISEQTIPTELHPNNTTIEYRLSRSAPAPPIFLFVIDTCQEDDSLQALKDTIEASLDSLPPDALVGLITYGTMVSIKGPVVSAVSNISYRHKCTSSATPSVPNRTSSGAAATIAANKSKKC